MCVPQVSLVGRKAGLLDGLDYVQGDAVSITPGTVTCVVIWDTRTLTPGSRRISEMSKQRWGKHRAKVQFVAITRERKEKVVAHLKKSHDLRCAVAVDNTTDKHIYGNYPTAAVPTAFLVGRDGLIKWHGHPMDSTLKGVIIKEFEREALEHANSS